MKPSILRDQQSNALRITAYDRRSADRASQPCRGAIVDVGRYRGVLRPGRTCYPSKPVRFVVSFPQGGPNDILGRIVAGWLSQQLKQPFDVDNKLVPVGQRRTTAVVRAGAGQRLTRECCGSAGSNVADQGVASPATSRFALRDVQRVAGSTATPSCWSAPRSPSAARSTATELQRPARRIVPVAGVDPRAAGDGGASVACRSKPCRSSSPMPDYGERRATSKMASTGTAAKRQTMSSRCGRRSSRWREPSRSSAACTTHGALAGAAECADDRRSDGAGYDVRADVRRRSAGARSGTPIRAIAVILNNERSAGAADARRRWRKLAGHGLRARCRCATAASQVDRRRSDRTSAAATWIETRPARRRM